jgi:hypothetical protein
MFTAGLLVVNPGNDVAAMDVFMLFLASQQDRSLDCTVGTEGPTLSFLGSWVSVVRASQLGS